jgi:hypothetical protein
LRQVPTDPATLQAEQVPEQALLQHTSSTQKPEPHWLSVVHWVPFVSLVTHELPLQY